MAQKTTKETLIFIDTNIYLDFYRAREATFEKSMIQHIDKNHDKIITTDQVLMEYKNNRQKVIIDALKGTGNPEVNIRPPAFLSEAQPMQMLQKRKNL